MTAVHGVAAGNGTSEHQLPQSIRLDHQVIMLPISKRQFEWKVLNRIASNGIQFIGMLRGSESSSLGGGGYDPRSPGNLYDPKVLTTLQSVHRRRSNLSTSPPVLLLVNQSMQWQYPGQCHPTQDRPSCLCTLFLLVGWKLYSIQFVFSLNCEEKYVHRTILSLKKKYT